MSHYVMCCGRVVADCGLPDGHGGFVNLAWSCNCGNSGTLRCGGDNTKQGKTASAPNVWKPVPEIQPAPVSGTP